MSLNSVFISCVFLFIAACVPQKPTTGDSGSNTSNNTSLVKSIKTIEAKGGRLGLSPDGKIVAYDKRGKDGYFDIWTMNIDGSNKECLTCNNPSLPKRNVGQPAWHPTGKYLIAQVEKQEHFEGLASGLSANPGAGYYNDIWVIEYPSNKAYPIHIVPEGIQHGVLHPHFSKDGKKISWSQAYKAAKLYDPARLAGSWKLKVADVKIKTDGSLAIENIKTYQPGDDVIYENHGFSPDGKSLIFTTNLKSNHPVTSSDIYTLNLETEELNPLTDNGYNEHGQYSPDGTKVIWMSSNGNIEPDKVKEIGFTDWWIMNADGSNKQRLTYFNKEGHPHFVFNGICSADFAWYPNSKGIVGYYFTNPTIKNMLTKKFKEVIVTVELK